MDHLARRSAGVSRWVAAADVTGALILSARLWWADRRRERSLLRRGRHLGLSAVRARRPTRDQNAPRPAGQCVSGDRAAGSVSGRAGPQPFGAASFRGDTLKRRGEALFGVGDGQGKRGHLIGRFACTLANRRASSPEREVVVAVAHNSRYPHLVPTLSTRPGESVPYGSGSESTSSAPGRGSLVWIANDGTMVRVAIGPSSGGWRR